MKTIQKHIINKAFLEVNTNNKKVAYDLKDDLSMFLKQDVFPFIETYFKKLENSLPSEIVQIPKLNLDLTTSSKDNFKELKQAIKKQFVTEIQKTIKASTNEYKEAIFISNNDNNLKTFLYFLEEGILPWNSLKTDKNRFDKKELQEIVNATNFSMLFRQKIRNKFVQIRLVNQFDANEIKLILYHGFKDAISVNKLLNNRLVNEIKKLNTLNKKLIWHVLINYLNNNDTSKFINELIKIVKQLEKDIALNKTEYKQVNNIVTILLKNKQVNVDENLQILKYLSKSKDNIKRKNDNINKMQLNIKKNSKENIDINTIEVDYQEIGVIKSKSETINKLSEENQITNNEVFYQDKKTTYYVENAGLILLHPFLKQFFKTCKLLDKENNIIDVELAVHLLHYIATKNEKQLESNLIFEKFLCGVPIKQSISRNITISKKLKTQTEELLESVIQNWEILKNASTDLLCNEFLQRAGKLSFKGDNPKINIERKTQDILLDKLPWNISICKLPWLDKLIFTDW